MKRYITVLALSALVCSSCSDFLDVQPEGNATTTSYFLNDQQAIDAIDGLYERFHQEGCYGRELFWEQGAACDIVWGRTRGYNSLATLAYTGDESPLRDVFSRMYSTMSRTAWLKERERNETGVLKKRIVEVKAYEHPGANNWNGIIKGRKPGISVNISIPNGAYIMQEDNNMAMLIENEGGDFYLIPRIEAERESSKQEQ